MKLKLAGIKTLFEAQGGCQYTGEPVTQLEHSLQTAQLAEQAQAGAALITAALLHDLGHMANDMGEMPTLRGIDDKHQYHGVSALRGVFPAAVLDPIRLHVDAKRYLCAIDASYRDRLSSSAKLSLELQGGPFSAAEVLTFLQQPFARQAVAVRRGDDQASEPSARPPAWQHFLPVLQSIRLPAIASGTPPRAGARQYEPARTA